MQHYLTNPQVIHETIDGETIIIDLASGTYFSLQGSAPEIWAGLAAGESDEQIVTRLEAVYTGERADITAAVETFLQELAGDQLIMPSENGAAQPAVAAPAGTSERAQFVAPKLERFTDMQDIILLDPVHKVDSEGWPHSAPVADHA